MTIENENAHIDHLSCHHYGYPPKNGLGALKRFFLYRPEVGRVNRKLTPLLSTMIQNTPIAVGNKLLSHTVQKLVILAYFAPPPPRRGGKVGSTSLARHDS